MSSSRKAPFLCLVLLLTVALAACGGGGGGGSTMGTGGSGGSGGTGGSGSTTFSYPTTPVLILYAPITAIAPVNATGLTSFYLQNPMEPLPDGLSLNPDTGVISGTPTSFGFAGTTYTIGASGAGGKGATTTVVLQISPVAANAISYGAAAFNYTANIPAQPLTPETAGEAVTGWSISPQLPAGLSFSASTGIISGTPTGASLATTYTVTARNAAGPLSVSFTIQVETSILVNLGHVTNISALNFNGSTLLSVDQNGHWVLWNYSSGAMITFGDSACFSGCSAQASMGALAGPTAVIRTKTGLQLLSASTGAVQGTITAASSWWLLATDGSYVVAGSSAGLTVWSPTGQVLTSLTGNYSSAMAFASPGAVRVATGPAGANVIETLTVPGGADSVSPAFNGTFSGWFIDGTSFFSVAGGTELVYSNTVVQEAAFPVPSSGALGGEGSWLWSGALTIYALSAPTTVVASYSFPGFFGSVIPQGSTLAVVNTATDTVSVVDLSGATPAKVDYSLPISSPNGYAAVTNFAASSASQWIVGTNFGVLLDGASLSGTPRFFGYGQALSVAGNANQIALATASGRILYFNASTLAQEGTISFTSNTLAISPDGSVLAAAPPPSAVNGPSLGARDLNIYSLPGGGAPLYSWPYPTSSGSSVLGISLAGTGSGLVLGQTLVTSSAFELMISAPTGGTASFSATLSSPSVLELSADATVFATSNAIGPAVAVGTNLYQNDKLVTAVNGWPVGWIDDSHLLVNSYQTNVLTLQADYWGCTLYAATGATSGSCELPEVQSFQNISAGSIYANSLNKIYEVSTGAASWASANPLSAAFPLGTSYLTQPPSSLDTIAGNRAVFVSGPYVVAQTY
jgi:hypothetical protein